MRLRDLVLVVREDEVEPAAVDLERRPEQLLGHHGALDVPAGAPAAPRRVPPRVLAGLVRLPEREVARILLARVRLLILDLVGPLTGESAVPVELRDAVVDVAVDLVRVAARDQLLDRGDHLRDHLARLRLVVGHAEAEVARVLEVPLRRARGELGARAGRRVVDLVVDVGDVVHERRVVAARDEPAAEPHADHERARVADVRAGVHGRPAEVHPDRAWYLRQLLLAARQRVRETHPLSLDRDSQQPLMPLLGESDSLRAWT